MPIDMNDPRNTIPNGDLLSLKDMILAQFHPEVSTDEATGATTYPRKTYLSDLANQRKLEMDRKARVNTGE